MEIDRSSFCFDLFCVIMTKCYIPVWHSPWSQIAFIIAQWPSVVPNVCKDKLKKPWAWHLRTLQIWSNWNIQYSRSVLCLVIKFVLYPNALVPNPHQHHMVCFWDFRHSSPYSVFFLLNSTAWVLIFKALFELGILNLLSWAWYTGVILLPDFLKHVWPTTFFFKPLALLVVCTLNSSKQVLKL